MALGTSTNKKTTSWGRVIIIILAAVFLIVGIVFQQLSFNTSSSASSSIQGKNKGTTNNPFTTGLTETTETMSVSAIRIPANGSLAKAAVIFLHGLGDSGDGWSWLPQLVSQSKLINDPINYVFPNAPKIPVTINNGFAMPAWFDIYELGSPHAKQDVTGFFKSCEVLKEFILEQHNKFNIPLEKIIIGGFSQGAAISLATLALLDTKIGGCVALSGFCPVRNEITDRYNKNPGVNFDTPIFQGHGTVDPVINYDYGKQTSELYKQLGFKNLKFNTYEGVAHSASEEELADVIKFIKNIVEK